MATQQTIRGQWAHQQTYTYPKYPAQYQNTNNYTPSSTNSYGNHRVPTASSPGNISNTSANSNCSSQTGSQSGGGGGTVSGGGGGSGLSANGPGVTGGPVTVAANGSSVGGAMAGCGGSGGSNASASGSCSGGEQLSKTNLYIRGLNPSTTDKDLVSMCSSFGTITSTKAILDKTTNKCKGYGFVDFENPLAAEGAVKALTAKNIQAQMAKVGIQYLHRRQNTQEQDPTNLYISNLPGHFKESDVDGLLVKYGQVISTRILRHANGNSKGVGFARMESKEKCEQIIQIFNGQLLQGSEEPLLVKFADGGNKKKNLYKNNDNKMWRDGNDGLTSVGGFDPNTLVQNGVTPQHMMPATINSYNRHYSQMDMLQMAQAYSVPNTQWLSPYMIPGGAAAAAANIPPVDDYSMGVSHMATHMAAAAAAAAYKNENNAAAAQAARSISVVLPSPDGAGVPYNAHVIPQLATQMSAMQLGNSGAYMYPAYYPAASQFIHMPVGGGGGGGGGGDHSDHHTPNAGSPEDHFPYAQQQGGPK